MEHFTWKIYVRCCTSAWWVQFSCFHWHTNTDAKLETDSRLYIISCVLTPKLLCRHRDNRSHKMDFYGTVRFHSYLYLLIFQSSQKWKDYFDLPKFSMLLSSHNNSQYSYGFKSFWGGEENTSVNIVSKCPWSFFSRCIVLLGFFLNFVFIFLFLESWNCLEHDASSIN